VFFQQLLSLIMTYAQKGKQAPGEFGELGFPPSREGLLTTSVFKSRIFPFWPDDTTPLWIRKHSLL